MTLAETYRAERLIDRRSRGRKARIAGRIIGFGLMACLLVAIRTDPELRAMVDDAALAVIGAAMPDTQEVDAQNTAALAELGLDAQSAAGSSSSVSHMPQSTVKIRRGGVVND